MMEILDFALFEGVTAYYGYAELCYRGGRDY